MVYYKKELDWPDVNLWEYVACEAGHPAGWMHEAFSSMFEEYVHAYFTFSSSLKTRTSSFGRWSSTAPVFFNEPKHNQKMVELKIHCGEDFEYIAPWLTQNSVLPF